MKHISNIFCIRFTVPAAFSYDTISDQRLPLKSMMPVLTVPGILSLEDGEVRRCRQNPWAMLAPFQSRGLYFTPYRNAVVPKQYHY